MQTKPQLFRLSHEVVDCFNMKDVEATIISMRDMDLLRDPFFWYHVEVDAHFYDKLVHLMQPGEENMDFSVELQKEMNTKVDWVFGYKTDPETGEFQRKIYIKTPARILDVDMVPDSPEYMDEQLRKDLIMMSICVRLFLAVVLATKNVEKKAVVNTKSSISPQRRKDSLNYSSTITLKIGKITETYISEGGTGRNVRPHLRRGHIRTQRFGAGLTESKKIFIQPVFVNADEEWIAAQRTYRVVP